MKRTEAELTALLPSGSPIFLHLPHGDPCHGITEEVRRDFANLSLLVLGNQDGTQYKALDDVTLVTYHNYPLISLIERCYASYGINNFVVLGQEVQDWDWGSKIKLVLDYLNSGACYTQYILCTDANDILMINDPATLIDRFQRYSCDILFCNTFVDYPPNKECRDFETLTYYTHPLHCRLSAGAYLARREALLPHLHELLKAYCDRAPWATKSGVFEDQLGWRYLHSIHYPKIKVDYRCLIFKRYDVFRNIEE